MKELIKKHVTMDIMALLILVSIITFLIFRR